MSIHNTLSVVVTILAVNSKLLLSVDLLHASWANTLQYLVNHAHWT